MSCWPTWQTDTLVVLAADVCLSKAPDLFNLWVTRPSWFHSSSALNHNRPVTFPLDAPTRYRIKSVHLMICSGLSSLLPFAQAACPRPNTGVKSFHSEVQCSRASKGSQETTAALWLRGSVMAAWPTCLPADVLYKVYYCVTDGGAGMFGTVRKVQSLAPCSMFNT